MKKNSTNSSFVLLIVVTLLSKILAFGQELLFANYYGVTDISDVYIISITIPVTVFGFISAGVISGFIPLYKKEIKDHGRQMALSVANKIAVVLLAVCLVFVVVYYVSNGNIVSIFASGFDAEKKRLTIEYANFTVFSIFFIALTTFFNAYLQAEGKTIYSGMISIPLNIVISIFILYSYFWGKSIYLAVGFLVGSIIQTLILYIIAKKKAFRLSINGKLFDRSVINFIKNLGILALGSSLSQINVLVDKTIASGITSGGIAALEYGNRVFDLISGIFILSISTIQFPRMVEKKDEDDYGAFVDNCLFQICMIILPIALFILFFSKETIGVIYNRGAFDDAATELTGSVIMFYGIGFVFIGLREILCKAFYARNNMKTPVINSVIGLLLNIVMNYILSYYMGIGGLALATSIASIFVSVLLLIKLSKETHYCLLKKKTKEILIVIVGCLILIILMRWLYSYFMRYTDAIVAYFAVGMLFVTLYCLMLTGLKIFDFVEYIKLLVRKMKYIVKK